VQPVGEELPNMENQNVNNPYNLNQNNIVQQNGIINAENDANHINEYQENGINPQGANLVIQHQQHQQGSANVEATTSRRIPSFWKFNPRLWFAKVESSFGSNRIRADASKYDILVNTLDAEIIQEVADVMLNPPAEEKYETLKAAIIERLSDSADRQLHKLLNELELGDKKPSQLLPQMRSLAGNAITDDALRVKWLDLLPAQVSRLIKVLKATGLDEQATLADELLSGEPTVVAVSARGPSMPILQQNETHVAAVDHSLAQEVAALKKSLAQLLEFNKKIQFEFPANKRQQQQNRPRQRSQSRGRKNSRDQSCAQEQNPKWCWYHQVYGTEAQKCKDSCSFQGN